MAKIKGTKFYGLMKEGNMAYLNYVSDDIEYPKNHMNKDHSYLVEITVTKVYTKNPVIIELNEEETDA